MNQIIFLTVFMGFFTIVRATPVNDTLAAKFEKLGGTDAWPGEFPHTVSIQSGYSHDRGFEYHLCSGSIIHPLWILTAAHCVPSVSYYVIKAGKYNINALEANQQIREVETIYRHENYRSHYPHYSYDIALLKLEEELVLNEMVQAIQLPAVDSIPDATEELTVAGWGSYFDIGRIEGYAANYWNSDRPNILQKRIVHPVAFDDCKNLHGYSVVDETYNLCTTAVVSSCWGDAGSPLINKHRELIAIHSWGVSCCCTEGDAPDVNVRVFAVIDWIKSYVPLIPLEPGSSSKLYLAHWLIPVQICSLFGILYCTYSL